MGGFHPLLQPFSYALEDKKRAIDELEVGTMMLNLLEWVFSLQTCGYGLQTTANVTVTSQAHGHFSSQTNTGELVRTPRRFSSAK